MFFDFPCFWRVFTFRFQGFQGVRKEKCQKPLLFWVGLLFSLLFFSPRKQGLEGQGAIISAKNLAFFTLAFSLTAVVVV